MALTFTETLTENVNGLTALITNTTTYGPPNQNRNQAAEYLLWASLDSSGTRTYDNPSPGDVLNDLTYTVSMAISGWHQSINIRIQLYNGSTPYLKQVVNGQGVITTYESIVYRNGFVYRCIQNVTGVAPDDPTGASYWAVVSDLSTILSNTNIEVSIKNYQIEAQLNIKLNNAFADKRKCNCTIEDLEFILKLFAQLIGAGSEFSNGVYNEYQKIIESIEASL